ncbi:hypothetical protein SLEP1_g18377 [Rubroshorea leprosula]|uniref:Uncharacterized protein n=1 Tax=Rubroshorea leprosula TaxID=152421 RepID=A0AAV5IXA8_9ROSI|nr:hypothetical protein SLEP1_g18377 [Rubroshorea leprosula]
MPQSTTIQCVRLINNRENYITCKGSALLPQALIFLSVGAVYCLLPLFCHCSSLWDELKLLYALCEKGFYKLSSKELGVIQLPLGPQAIRIKLLPCKMAVHNHIYALP